MLSLAPKLVVNWEAELVATADTGNSASAARGAVHPVPWTTVGHFIL